MNNNPIGIFDSGVGGLTVASEIISAMPNENIVYFGDTARVPYGDKSRETVTKFSKQIIRFLLSKNVKAVIIACNTASSNSYPELVGEFDIPIFEMVGYGMSAALSATKNKKIGVIGTEATIRSGAYERAIKQADGDSMVYAKACPLFVPLVEEGWTENVVAESTVEIYLRNLVDKNIDTLLLGCTHYPLLKNLIQKTAGATSVVNPAVCAAESIKKFLFENNMAASPQNISEKTFFVSDNTEKFDKISKIVLNKSFDAVKVDIEAF